MSNKLNNLTPQQLTELPYAEFFVGATKKNPHEAVPGVHLVGKDTYLETAAKTGKHYSRFLGRTFAITSYLTFALAVKADNNLPIAKAHTVAAVYSWRVLYEGMGLSGWTPEAEELAKNIGSIGAYDTIKVSGSVFSDLAARGYDVYQVGEDDAARFYVRGASAFRYAWECATGDELEYEVAQYFYWAVLITAAYSALERNLDEQTTAEAVLADEGEHLLPFIRQALTYGTLRRGSKGLGVSAAVEDNGANGLYLHLTDEHVTLAGNGIVGEMLAAIRDVQKLSDRVAELEQ